MGRFRGEHAWGVLAAEIIGYELLCDDGQLLSEAMDRWLAKYPIRTRVILTLVVLEIYLHLINAFPPCIDILSQDFPLWRKISGLVARLRHSGGR